MSGTDATSCKVCGGPFAAKRITIDGAQYHERCALMSYPPHTHDDYVRLHDLLEGLRLSAVEACNLLAERKYGNPARSPGHNARLKLESALAALSHNGTRKER